MLGSLSGVLGAVGAGTATNWPGSAGDPDTHVVYAQASNAPSSRSLVAPPQGFSDIRYVAGIAGRPFREVLGPGDCCAADGSGKPFAPTNLPSEAAPAPSPAEEDAVANAGLTVQGLPIYKPPYGVLSAINLDRGEITWQVPAGDTPDNIRNHPALRGLNIPEDRTARSVGCRADGDEVDRGDGRPADHHDAGTSARSDAARVRQDQRAGKWVQCSCRRPRAARR